MKKGQFIAKKMRCQRSALASVQSTKTAFVDQYYFFLHLKLYEPICHRVAYSCYSSFDICLFPIFCAFSPHQLMSKDSVLLYCLYSHKKNEVNRHSTV